jgi:nucleoside-diphosphate-sugar epimerase
MNQHVYFITGGSGLLGRHLIQAVYAHDPRAELRLLVRGQRLPALPDEILNRAKLVQGDVTQPESYAAAMRGVETVIHSAALISFKKGDRRAISQTNIDGTRAVIEAASASGCRNFVHISSISAIGRRADPPWDESLYPAVEALARDAYARSKVRAEGIVLRYARQMHVTILNPSVIIGPGARQWQNAFRWLRLLPALPMLSTLNSFVDARDVARAAILAARSPRSGERYIVTAENIGMPAFTRMALRTLGSRTVVFPMPDSVIRSADAALAGFDWLGLNPGVKRLSELNVDKAYSSQKIRRELGWAPTVSIEESLADTLAPLMGLKPAARRAIAGRTPCLNWKVKRL